MRQRDLIKLVVNVMMDYRYRRGKAMLRKRIKHERLINKELGRNAEASAIIDLVRANS